MTAENQWPYCCVIAYLPMGVCKLPEKKGWGNLSWLGQPAILQGTPLRCYPSEGVGREGVWFLLVLQGAQPLLVGEGEGVTTLVTAEKH